MTINIQQLRALRHADCVVFNSHANGHAEVTAILDEEHSPTGFEQRVSIPVANLSTGLTGRVGCNSLRAYNEGWRTFVNHVLRVGDVLSVSFRADHGTTPICRAAKADGWIGDGCGPIYFQGLHADELWLVIGRRQGGSDKRLDFMLDARTSPENSARMCSLV